MKASPTTLDSLLSHYQNNRKRIDMLVQRRTSLRQELTNIESELQLLLNGESEQRETGPSAKRQAKAPQIAWRRGMLTAEQHAFRYLTEQGQPKHANDIARYVLDAGYPTASKFDVLVSSIASNLTKNIRFSKVAPNTFGLTAWEINSDKAEDNQAIHTHTLGYSNPQK